MNLTRRSLNMLGLGLFVTGAKAMKKPDDNYPNRAVTIIVPFPAGGGTDATVRIIARHFQEITGQVMTVENRPGGGTLVGLNHLKNQKPDGYSLGVMTRAQHTAYWRAGGNVPVHPLNDLTYISGTHGSIFGMLVKPDSPFNSLDDLARYAKENPGKLSFGNVGPGSGHNLIALEFARLAEIDVLHLPFKGEAEINTSVMGGHVNVSVSSGSFIPLVAAGKLKLIALARDERLAEFPDWSTFADQGYNVKHDTSVGVGGPQGMDESVVAKLDSIFKEMCDDPKFVSAIMRIYQPVQYIPTAAYRQSQQEQFAEAKRIIEQYQLRS